MISNLEKYKKDLDQLIADGEQLHMAMQKECLPEQFKKQMRKVLKKGDIKLRYTWTLR